jgi:transcriptional regulator with XRE-family HTH domain
MIELLTNPQIENELGKRLKNRRVDRNLSQSTVAQKSGLSRRTITAIENGEGTSLRTLIALLRALDSLDTLNGFLPDPGISPVAMMLREDPTPYRVTPMGETRYPSKYASKPRKKPAPTPWKWGDEK